ncbi:MAG: preprotein translocase subunit SecE, partial [Sphingopyxis sp.]|uniref:preprotein translocase subunit SecE n=1 Tax=Sphingopyxis sp. TaxID=1908224 RepID=UPI0040366FA5
TVPTGADKAKRAAANALLLGSFVAFYLLSSRGALAQWGALIVLLGAAVVVFAVSESGKQLIAFGRDAWREVKKVVWPARKEAIQMTASVFACVYLMALVQRLTDQPVEWLNSHRLLGGRK